MWLRTTCLSAASAHQAWATTTAMKGSSTFSKAKGVLVKQRLNAAKLIYPPYGKSIQKLIQKLFIR